MIARVKLHYETFKEPMAAEKYAELRVAIPSLPAEIPVEKYYWTEHPADLAKLLHLDVKFEVVPTPKKHEHLFLETLLARLQGIETKLSKPQVVDRSFNDRVSVHVPGLGLLAITEVDVVEDCCTDTLNRKLEEGWRIIAACPQSDQRRPDYVLGRSK